MATSNEVKAWEKPWSTGDMINKSNSWSLAGDAGVKPIVFVKIISVFHSLI
jgi:hypothetical protein